jgi:Sulfotransferase domain
MNVDDEMSKRVFCLGMNKTGTSTMKHCFEILGLTPIASPTTLGKIQRLAINQFYKEHNYDAMLDIAENYKSFEDRPWNMWEMYRYLDKRFPDSRFILTIRDVDSWWHSMENWVTVTKPDVLARYKLHLRTHDFSYEAMTESYLRHNTEIIKYFKGTGKLLLMNVEQGDEWGKLCSFLGTAIPDIDFPHANKQAYSPKDAKLLKRRKKLKRGIVCQECQHITLIPKQSSKNKARIFSAKKPLELLTGIKSNLSLNRRTLKKHPVTDWLHRAIPSTAYRMLASLPFNHTKQLDAIKQSNPNLNIDDFAVVTCFFNPSNSQRRIENFKKFLKGINTSGVRVLVVELAFGSQPFVVKNHKHIIQLRTDDILWHKERLLNIGIKQLLSQGYKKIAWLDGDIIFENPNWPWLISAQLETDKLCQVFSRVSIQNEAGTPPQISRSSVKYFKAHGRYFSQPARLTKSLSLSSLLSGQSGFGWAARAEVLSKVQLFEHAIIGGGDKLMLAASLTQNMDNPKLAHLTFSTINCQKCNHVNRSSHYTKDYIDWAKKWSAAVNFQVGYAPMNIKDMFHGNRKDRAYMGRRDILFKHNYNPTSDLFINNTGCLAWSTGKDDFHHAIKSYFLSRREDA